MPIGTRRAAARKAVKARRWRKPPLYITQILAWADAHHEQTGRWPRRDTGRVRDALEEKWRDVDNALRLGLRGLPGEDSLARLLARFRGVRNRKGLPPYTIDQILGWADAFFARHGRWPLNRDGNIDGAPGETWMAVEMALHNGLRGLPGGSSLARLFAKHRGRRNKGDLHVLTTQTILKWADSHRQRTGMWPTIESGAVQSTPGETWRAIEKALRNGTRGLRGGSSLARLLYRSRGVPIKHRRQPPLSIEQILAWADAFHERTRKWPNVKAGAIPEARGETWGTVQIALNQGKRGLSGGSSLAMLLAKHRGVRNVQDLQTLTIKQILAWADAHFQRHGVWPAKNGGPIDDTLGDTWAAVNMALSHGGRGLPGGSSLAQLLADRRGVPHPRDLPKFSTARILAWADAYHDRHGAWPRSRSGSIAQSPGDTWARVQTALREGLRGLKGGSSLAKLLAKHRGVRNLHELPNLTVEQIVAWADVHFKRHGAWPRASSGTIEGAAGETWAAVDHALSRGSRGLVGGTSLCRLLAEKRGAPHRDDVRQYTSAQILAWADAYYQRTGMWPNKSSGPISEMPGQTWSTVNESLRKAARGLRGGSSLARLLKRHRGVLPKHRRKPPLTIETILKWADAYHRRTGHWPNQTSGKVPEAPSESWGTIDAALRKASRGLPKGLALGKLWAQYRGVRNLHSIPKLSPEQILQWADAHYRRTRTWPQVRSGTIIESPTDNWLSVENALRIGLRGLPGGSSLKRFLADHRRNGQVRAVAPRPATAKRAPVSPKRRKPR